MFTRTTDQKLKKTIVASLGIVGAVALSAYFGLHPRVSDVGYRPEQPVPFSHKLHAGDLGMKCMYCHTSAETSAHSPIPSTQTCMNCHSVVKSDSPKLALVKESWEKGTPIEWRRIHKLPDYVAFNHARHIRAQIDCASCHGEVETMGVVTQMKPLTMGWCLDCHRSPQDYVVPAREISGIFTGLEKDGKAMWAQAIGDGYGRWVPASDGVHEAVSGISANEGKTEVKGLLVPNTKPVHGPENCSSCHY